MTTFYYALLKPAYGSEARAYRIGPFPTKDKARRAAKRVKWKEHELWELSQRECYSWKVPAYEEVCLAR